MVAVNFRYLTGLKSALFSNARLRGSWDAAGRFASDWSELPMLPFVAEDGCPGFQRTVQLDGSQAGTTFSWGVVVDGPGGSNIWGVPTEVAVAGDGDRYRQFVLTAQASTETFYLTFARRLGARKSLSAAGAVGLTFAVWAPYAQAVAVVFGSAARGYIADDGTGIDAARAPIPLARGVDGIWTSPVVPSFDIYRGVPYMYRITDEQGTVRYRTDLFSRAQVGTGSVDPAHQAWDQSPASLEGSKGCSVIVGQDTVASALTPNAPRVSRSEFWQTEFTVGHTVPSRIQDLIIYELHVGALGFGLQRPGNLRDAIAFLDHLVLLGVNAVELLPLAEFSGAFGWGYGDTHHFVIASSAGGLDEYKNFVRECHRRGLTVIQDVCYNHYDSDAERAEWQFDSALPEHNAYYWYEGKSTDYGAPDGGYLDNGSAGYTPRFAEEVVRQQFIASAALLVDECHVDGFRVDLTQAIHRDNALHANGWSIGAANLFGQKLLREWSRTLTLIKPNAMLIAEDHTGWDAVTQAPDQGGLGFGARWFAAFYHDLIGDSDSGAGHARVLREAGFGGDGPLGLDGLAGSLYSSQYGCIVYHESHDEAGNSPNSARTLVTAVDGAPLFGATRDYGEARARVVFGVSLFSAGAPMFLMGEEIGATQPYRYDDYAAHREDIIGARTGTGAHLFRYYQDAIALCRRSPAARSHEIDVIYSDPANRVLAFVRRSGGQQLLVVVSFSNRPYGDGFVLKADRLEAGAWQEIFNSDAAIYGGQNVGNFGASIPSPGGTLQAILPANGLLVLAKS